MNITLRSLQSRFVNGRAVVYATACDGNRILTTTTLAYLLEDCRANGHVIDNAQEVLSELVLNLGFSA
jgi:hypothetical protein